MRVEPTIEMKGFPPASNAAHPSGSGMQGLAVIVFQAHTNWQRALPTDPPAPWVRTWNFVDFGISNHSFSGNDTQT